MHTFVQLFSTTMNVNIEASWKKILSTEFKQPYFQNLVAHIKVEKEQGKIIYPTGANIFKAFELTPFEKVKVLLLGQDPYHGPNQAHGLSFSVQKGVSNPPSLQNIYKELRTDIGIQQFPHGNLSHWATQGVLLLNASLTVRDGEANSHSKIGWTTFTDAVIKTISDKKEKVVFILWGKFAQQKIGLINADKHFIIQSAHPSPLSAYNGFWGSKPFSKTNEYLTQNNINPIDWAIV